MDPGELASGRLSFSGAAMPQRLASLEIVKMGKVYTVTLMMGTNDVSRGESRKTMRLQEKVSCILEELRVSDGQSKRDEHVKGCAISAEYSGKSSKKLSRPWFCSTWRE